MLLFEEDKNMVCLEPDKVIKKVPIPSEAKLITQMRNSHVTRSSPTTTASTSETGSANWMDAVARHAGADTNSGGRVFGMVFDES